MLNLAVVVGTLLLSQASLAIELQELKRDLSEAKQRLGSQRDVELLQREKIGSKLSSLEKKLMLKRRQQLLARMKTQDREAALGIQKKAEKSFAKDADYIGSILRGYALELDLTMAPGQKNLVNASHSKAFERDTELEQKIAILDVAMDRLESVLGGEVLNATAVDSDGTLVDGRVCNFGPAMWFLSRDTQQSGALVLDSGAEYGRIIDSGDGDIQSLFENGIGEMSIDVTGGKARAIDLVQSDPLRIFKKGGIWLWPILGIALVSAFCGVMKLIQLTKIKNPSGLWVADILKAVRGGNIEDAEDVAMSEGHPAGKLIAKALSYVDSGVDVVEEVIYEQLIGVQSSLQKWLPFIAVTAATAPLLGLLGTVSGMIRMFNVITVTGTGDVKPMAGGISEALVTTLFGLVVAIPALVLHAMLSRRSNGVVQNTEKLGLTFVNGLRKL
ncbi:MotA/TolQ/ExbB proton channel family protein [Rubritalea sp.]|uniref:MotA/TolQ/ExbB proton channel family protein n=1 Tax=Rubritalea sp. TaxID=2109375 RepID=UPI003242DF3C